MNTYPIKYFILEIEWITGGNPLYTHLYFCMICNNMKRKVAFDFQLLQEHSWGLDEGKEKEEEEGESAGRCW